ncbi:hypothetical protein JKP88DRAFT_250442 [Tribonema minus]|uniref:Uncharacterized protein n=1 Tax=Tribonema minus TaxID=303371 RepID=A0A835YIG1_9STRA|nr:hypothetical protein JKP88DRAFT_250442 [Tribonema minus]
MKPVTPLLLAYLLASSGNAFRSSFPKFRRRNAAVARSTGQLAVVCMRTEEELGVAGLSDRELLAEIVRKLDRTGAHALTSLADINAAVDTIGKNAGRLVEIEVSKAVRVQSPDLEPVTAGSLVELAGMFRSACPSVLAEMAARELRDKHMIQHVISHAQTELKAHWPMDNVEWVTDGEVNTASVARFLGTILANKEQLDEEVLQERQVLKHALWQVLDVAKAVQARDGSKDKGIKQTDHQLLLKQHVRATVQCGTRHSMPFQEFTRGTALSSTLSLGDEAVTPDEYTCEVGGAMATLVRGLPKYQICGESISATKMAQRNEREVDTLREWRELPEQQRTVPAKLKGTHALAVVARRTVERHSSHILLPESTNSFHKHVISGNDVAISFKGPEQKGQPRTSATFASAKATLLRMAADEVAVSPDVVREGVGLAGAVKEAAEPTL